MKILLIQQKMIGDVLTSSILAEAIKKKHPHAQVDYLINSNTFPVVANHPSVDNFILLTPETERNYLKLFQFLREIRGKKYSHVIDVYGKLSSNLISYFSKAKIRVSYYKKEKSFIYTHNIHRLKTPEHHSSLAVENRMKLLEPLGIGFMDIAPKIYLSENETKEATNFLKNGGIDTKKPLYMLSVLGSNSKKSYPSSYMSELIDFIVVKNPSGQLLFNYMPHQKEEAEKIFNATSSKTKAQTFFDIYANDLRELLALTKCCNAVIGNEGGLINMAKALEVPTFILFSPYLKKVNWFGIKEAETHTAVHLADLINYKTNDWEEAEKNPEEWYSKFKPELVKPLLEYFLKKHNDL